MLHELKSMFEKQARVERFNIIQTFHACKQEEGKSVSSYVLKIKSYVEKLERLGYGLRGERKLKQRVVYLYMGNGVRAQVESIGSFDLVLSNGLVIFSKNDVLYFNVIPRDDIYEIDMLNLVLNVNSIYNVRNTTAKLNLDSTYLWQCRLAHISKKRIEKLHVSRQGASYFITFTDDFSRPGQTQWLYLKEGNHTLLDMVRSMINFKTLALSFWDYALESATRILNMVPTKKVDKTPCELCDNQGNMGYYFYFSPENKIVVAMYYAEFIRKNLISQDAMERNTKDMFLVYGGNPEAELRVTCYCDAGFETDRDDIKSQTGYVFFLNGGAVDWKSSKY
ncbi:retrotransposon protein, putative, ty1-copia subclass [Tanacetum coccineum]|uniref:Retrotransposon protein, putative, ty1-copia subclass n=1 Tax=Tanacetum coccineum TaxID=301880 RepID=A0ABQ5FAU8_9ASTR